jgi:fumarate reductase flavoprotein subunit
MCTGDYGNDAEMMDKYCPQASYLQSMINTSTGDGHKMAMWIGAEMELGPHGVMVHGPAGPMSNTPFLQVNLLGERFQNEDVPVQSNTNAVQRQPGEISWQVFDSKYPDELLNMGIGLGKHMVVTEKIRLDIEESAVKADTLEELAKKMGVPVNNFIATVSRYNKLARSGRDVDFGKCPDRMTTIEKPPYYAGEGKYGLYIVAGGLNVNTRLQSLDNNWQVIPGIYLAGNTVGNRFGTDYPTTCPGLSHGLAIFHGRLAGKNAATLENPDM